MALAPGKLREAIEEHGLQLRLAADGWHAETAKGTRLHRGGRATTEEAVEAALEKIRESSAAKEESRRARLWDVLNRGDFYVTTRPVAGSGRQWDAYESGSDALLVSGQTSLTAAVVAAERILEEER